METMDLFINGKFYKPSQGQYFDAMNPSNEEIFALVAEGTREDVERALEAANNASDTYKQLSNWERAEILMRIADSIEKHKEELAHALTLDQGKPFHTEAKNEVSSTITAFRDAAEQVKWLESSFIPVKDKQKRAFTVYQPRGVYGVISPWNFPYMMPTEFIAPGLAAGNTIVWTPAPSTAYCSVKLMEVIHKADIPNGIINIVTGKGEVVGDELVRNEGSDAIAFCGSTMTGKKIARNAAGKPVLMELGGNGPTIVFEDADIQQAVNTIAKGCFSNSGQICSATARIFVHETIHDEFVKQMTEVAKQIKQGDPFDELTVMGPLNNPEVTDKNVIHAKDSLDKGAIFHTGGKVNDTLGSNQYFEPTVVSNVRDDSMYFNEETFGPVAPIFSFKTTDEVLERASKNLWGLANSIYTKNINRAMSLAEKLKAGTININENSNYWEPHLPFGGVGGKQSGYGRVGGISAIKEMSDIKTITINIYE